MTLLYVPVNSPLYPSALIPPLDLTMLLFQSNGPPPLCPPPLYTHDSSQFCYQRCYNFFDLSSIYAVKYHLTTRIRLYQLSFLISMIPGPRSHFPALSDLPVI